MRKVVKDKFFEIVGKLDVIPRPTGDYPYVTFWELRDRQVVGKSQNGEYWLVDKP